MTPGDLRALAARLDGLNDTESRLVTEALRDEVRERCRSDGWLWLSFVRTRDEADPEQPVKPFPVHLEYLRELWRIMTGNQRVVIAKSRQMLVSWVVTAFCTWFARYTPNQAVYWQSQQYDDAAGMVSLPTGGDTGRAQFIEEGLPGWLKIPGTRCMEGRIQYPNGSMIQALAGGADKIRGKVVSIYVGDEFARQEDQTGVYTAVAPLMQKGARAIFVSTPNGASNMFATLWHGRPVGTLSAP